MGMFKAAFAQFVGSGEGTGFVAEELIIEQIVIERGDRRRTVGRGACRGGCREQTGENGRDGGSDSGHQDL